MATNKPLPGSAAASAVAPSEAPPSGPNSGAVAAAAGMDYAPGASGPWLARDKVNPAEQPTICRMVHYVAADMTCRAAVVVDVEPFDIDHATEQNPLKVNLVVYAKDAQDRHLWRDTVLTQVNTAQGLATGVKWQAADTAVDRKRHHCWHWPERLE